MRHTYRPYVRPYYQLEMAYRNRRRDYLANQILPCEWGMQSTGIEDMLALAVWILGNI